MRKVRLLLLAILFSFLLTGCWSSEELNDVAFVSLIIVDKTDDGIEVTLGIPLTNNLAVGDAAGGQSGNQKFGYFSRTADTIEDALQKIQGDLSRKANFGQNRNIVVGRAYAEEGIMPLIEYSANNPYMRLNTNLFMVDGYAKDEVSKATVVSERFIVTILNKYVEQWTSLQTTVRDFLISKTSGGDAVIPIIKFSQISEGALVGTASTVGTGGSAIFREGKLVDPILTPEQTSAAKSIRNQLRQYYFSTQSPVDEKPVGFYSTIVDVKTSITKKDDKYTMIVKSVSEVVILANNSEIDFSRYDHSRKMEERIEEYIDKLTSDTMKVIQQTGADVFHFDRYFCIKYPRAWKKVEAEWREFYRDQLEVDIQSVVNLRRKGSTVRSFNKHFSNYEKESGSEQ